jgi:hypothetical protein
LEFEDICTCILPINSGARNQAKLVRFCDSELCLPIEQKYLPAPVFLCYSFPVKACAGLLCGISMMSLSFSLIKNDDLHQEERTFRQLAFFFLE